MINGRSVRRWVLPATTADAPFARCVVIQDGHFLGHPVIRSGRRTSTHYLHAAVFSRLPSACPPGTGAAGLADPVPRRDGLRTGLSHLS